MKYLLPVFLVMFIGTARAEPPYPVLTIDGLGKVKLGMSVAEAEAALGERLPRLPADPETEACEQVQPAGRDNSDVLYMIEHDRVTRIDIYAGENADGRPRRSMILTDRGIGLGDSEETIRKMYGSTVVTSHRPYTGPEGRRLAVPNGDRTAAVMFETIDGRVDTLRVGFYPSVEYWEGCS